MATRLKSRKLERPYILKDDRDRIEAARAKGEEVPEVGTFFFVLPTEEQSNSLQVPFLAYVQAAQAAGGKVESFMDRLPDKARAAMLRQPYELACMCLTRCAGVLDEEGNAIEVKRENGRITEETREALDPVLAEIGAAIQEADGVTVSDLGKSPSPGK